MLCFADFDVPPSQWQKATGGFDMLGSGRHKIETQEGSTDLVAAKPVQSLIYIYTYIYIYIEFPREQFFKAVLRVLEERWKEFKNDPVKN